MTASSGLSSTDRKLVLKAFEAGQALERAMATGKSNLDQEVISRLEDVFRESLSSLRSADSELARKQAEYAEKIDLALGEKHLSALLVPLERLLNRAIRDEEFLYLESDQSSISSESRALMEAKPRIVICENLRSAFNVGAIFRTGECFLTNEIWLTGYTAPPSKTAMGTEEHVVWKSLPHTRDAIDEARAQGFKIVALELTSEAQPLDDFVWPEKTALVLGNERFGVDSATLEQCDAVVKIPTRGIKNSLNVGVAFGIAAATWRRTILDQSQDTISVSPIGYVRGGYTSRQASPRQGSYANELQFNSNARESEIVLEGKFNGKPSNFEQALNDLEGFDRVWLIFGFHQSPSWRPMTKPPRGDGTLKGVFATRAPHRPNRLGLSCVKLLKVNGRTLRISDHDLLDGTPIYDIKPYIPDADAFPLAKAGWVDHLPPPHAIIESERAREKLDWLQSEGEERLRGFLFEQLRYQPLDASRKRIETVSSTETQNPDSNLRTSFIIAFRTWRIHATVLTTMESHAGHGSSPTVTIEDLSSGYTENELFDLADPYFDKDLHRRFLDKFS